MLHEARTPRLVTGIELRSVATSNIIWAIMTCFIDMPFLSGEIIVEISNV